MNKKEFTLYDKIINYLMIKSFCMRNNGIHHGRMALALTIYHYGFYTKNHVLVDFSVNLLDSILEDEKNIQTPILNFTNGRIGIGWGMEYLLFKLTEINYNEILRQYLTYIDNRVKEYFLNDSFPPIIVLMLVYCIMFLFVIVVVKSAMSCNRTHHRL